MLHGGKVHQTLAKQLAARGAEHRVRVIVRYREHVAKAKAIESAKLPEPPSRVLTLLPAVALSASAPEIRALSEQPEVERIWPDLRVHACLDVSGPLIHAPAVWAEGYAGAGVRLAVLDTGLDLQHPDFAGRIAATADFTGEGVGDVNGHGTHVAGIACGDGTASGRSYRGIAPASALCVAKVLDRHGSAYMSDVMAGLDWAVKQNVQVVNLSLSGPPPGDGTDALSEACDLVVERGIVVCVAAGNSGPRASSIGPPGCARQVITVGASTDDDAVLEASSRGPTTDGRVKPDILFPGSVIISCRGKGTSLGSPLNHEYTEASGTSMATPHASGVAALLLEADAGLTAGQIKELMTGSAVSLGLEENTEGAGRGDALAALALAYQSHSAPETRGCLESLLGLIGLAGQALPWSGLKPRLS
jgi:subtilisin family serine protease